MLNVLDLTNGLLTTATVQAAIDRAAAEKQPLFFPNGTYTVTALTLPSDTALVLDKGAVLHASLNAADWEGLHNRPLLSAEGCDNISIHGGTFNGGGTAFLDDEGRWDTFPCRPMHTLFFKDCQNITVTNTTLTQSVGWTLHLDNCEHILLDGVIVRNPPWNKSRCSDGIDLNGCRHAEVRNCDVETGDDGICLKNARGDTPREDMFDIRVHDCRVATTCNPTKIGTETFGNIYDVVFENITVCKHSAITTDGPGEPIREMVNPLSAISVQSNDGAAVHDITFRNYRVEYALTPLFMILQPRNRFGTNKCGKLFNITVEHVAVKTSYRNSAILAADGMTIQNVRLSDITATNYELPSANYIATVPTGKEYPDIFHFPPFPVYGLYVCNADVTTEHCSFGEAQPSGRPMMNI